MRLGRLSTAVSPWQVPLPLPDNRPVYDASAAEETSAAVVDGELRSAVLSRDGAYRYRLTRRWGDGEMLAWVLQNPSTADANVDDQTVRRARTFAKAWGYDAFDFVNLWAYRETDSAAFVEVLLEEPSRARGPGNDAHVLAAATCSAVIVCAWGSGAGRAAEDELLRHVVEGRLRAANLRCLGNTADGAPWHPSRLPNGLTPEKYDPWKTGYLLPF